MIRLIRWQSALPQFVYFISCPWISGRIQRLVLRTNVLNTVVETNFGGKEIKRLNVLEKIDPEYKIAKIACDGGCGKVSR